MARFAYLECHCSLFRTVHSKICSWSVTTVSSALAIGMKRAVKLHYLAAFSSSH